MSALPRYTDEQLRAHADRTAARKRLAANPVPDEGLDLRRPRPAKMLEPGFSECAGEPVLRIVPRGGLLQPEPEPVVVIEVPAEPPQPYRPPIYRRVIDDTGDGSVVGLRPTVRAIQAVVAERFALSLMELLSQRRDRPTVWARQVAMYLAKVMTPLTLPELGRRFGGRDHTTVIHACRKVVRRMMVEPEVAALVANIKAELTAAVEAAAAKLEPIRPYNGGPLLAEIILAGRCVREQRVRAQLARPQAGNAVELRWAAEGPVDRPGQLETALVAA